MSEEESKWIFCHGCCEPTYTWGTVVSHTYDPISEKLGSQFVQNLCSSCYLNDELRSRRNLTIDDFWKELNS